MLPGFIGIGAQRAATTWMFKCMEEHPDIYVYAGKNINFFNTHYQKGIEFYKNQFDGVSNKKAVGEISPDYLANKKTPKRIKKFFDSMKFIVVIRNPVDRAFSAYMKFIYHNEGYSFEEAIKKRPALLTDGLYIDHLRNFLKYFDISCFHIKKYDDLTENNLKFIQSVYGFIGVDKDYSPKMLDKVSNPYQPKLIQYLKNGKVKWLIDGLKKTPLLKVYSGIYNKKKKSLKSNIVAPDTRDYLLNYYYKPNVELARLLGVELNLWNI